MPFCVDCKHYQHLTLAQVKTVQGISLDDAVHICNGVRDSVTGKVLSKVCRVSRNSLSYCGPTADLYESKNV